MGREGVVVSPLCACVSVGFVLCVLCLPHVCVCVYVPCTALCQDLEQNSLCVLFVLSPRTRQSVLRLEPWPWLRAFKS